MVSREPVAMAEEFACSVLEDTFPDSKPTISYHVKILTQAGRLEVRKRGRSHFSTLRWDVLGEMISELGDLPTARLADELDLDARHSLRASAPDGTDAALLTW